MLDAGVHFGHHPRRWNPKMAQYLFGVRNNVHIIDLNQTYPMMYQAMAAVFEVVKNGGRVLFVGTKPQASRIIKDAADRCGQYYVNHRWLGGMMTNWQTVSKSIQRLRGYERTLESGTAGMTKKEILKLTRDQEKLERAIGGIKEMGGVPNLLVVIDTNKEDTAIKEANTLGIPVVGILDSNSNPDGIDYPVPGNDDAIRSIEFYCDILSRTVLEAIQEQMTRAGVDLGASSEVPAEKAAKKPAKKESAKEPKTENDTAAKDESKPAAKKPAAKKPVEKKPATKKATTKTTAKKAE